MVWLTLWTVLHIFQPAGRSVRVCFGMSVQDIEDVEGDVWLSMPSCQATGPCILAGLRCHDSAQISGEPRLHCRGLGIQSVIRMRYEGWGLRMLTSGVAKGTREGMVARLYGEGD